MNINKVFPGKYLKVSDLDPESDSVLTIRTVKLEQVGRDEQAEEKPVLYFEEGDKGMVLNKTNAGVISKLFGEETEKWKGQKIALWINHDVQFGSDVVSAIRIRNKKV